MNRKKFLHAAGWLTGGTLVAGGRHVFGQPGELAEALRAIPDGEEFWKLVRAQFLFPDDYIYLNTGGIGPAPKPVVAMVESVMREQELSPRPGHDEAAWTRIKRSLAPFLGSAVSADELALTNSATEGINIILNGLRLKRGDEVITSSHEHVALNVPLLNQARLNGIRIRVFDPDTGQGIGNAERIESLINRRTRLIFISHITCTTGQVMPVAEIGNLSRDRGILFALDGAQSAGTMPVDLPALGIDFYATCGHKWLLGPRRTGILYVRRERLQELEPAVVGAYSDHSHDLAAGRLKLKESAGKFEYATQNESLYRGLEAAAGFLAAIGPEKIMDHNRKLAGEFFRGLSEMGHIEILSPGEVQYRNSMITFRVRGRESSETAGYLSGSRKIRVRVVSEAGLNGIRASFHVCNKEEDVAILLDELRKMGKQG